MQSSDFHNWPPLVWLLAAVLAVVIIVLQVGILGYAYEKIGIQRRTQASRSSATDAVAKKTKSSTRTKHDAITC